MSTKLNAEGLANERYITMPWEKEEDRRLFEELNAIAIRERGAYAEAIRKVAQPIADERDELREALEMCYRQMRYHFREHSQLLRAGAYNGANYEATFEAEQFSERLFAKYPKP
jgi:hypothetical protein